MGGGVGEDGSIAISVAIVGVCSVAIVEEEEQDPKWTVKTTNGGVRRRWMWVSEDDEQWVGKKMKRRGKKK